MKVIAEIKIIPIGVGISFGEYIAECERILQNKNLKIHLHSEGTNLEGDIDDVMSGIRLCIEAMHTLGVPRLSTHISLSSRIDKNESMRGKIESIEKRL